MGITEACKKVIDGYMGLRSGEKLLVLHDEETRGIAAAFVMADSGFDITSAQVTDFSKRPVALTPEMIDFLKGFDVVILAVTKHPGEANFRQKMKEFVKENSIRYGFMPDVTEEVLIAGTAISMTTLKKISTSVFNLVNGAARIEVKSHAGTALVVELGENIWKNTYGDYSKFPHDGTNIPSGEVYTWPKRVDGTLVVDGILGDHFSRKYGTLEKNPLSLIINDSIIKGVQCSNPGLKNEFMEYILKDDFSSRINEIGIGTNTGISKLYGLMLIDEKFPGLHMAVGNPCIDTCKRNIKSIVHCDMLIRDATIIVDGKVLMHDGRYDADILA